MMETRSGRLEQPRERDVGMSCVPAPLEPGTRPLPVADDASSPSSGRTFGSGSGLRLLGARTHRALPTAREGPAGRRPASGSVSQHGCPHNQALRMPR